MLNRSISKWAMVLLVINGVIGSGIFGLPARIKLALVDTKTYSSGLVSLTYNTIKR